MLQMRSVSSPTLAAGAFTVLFDDFKELVDEVVVLPITNTATGGGAVIPMTNTSGMVIGQIITIRDTLHSEVLTIGAVTPGVSVGTTGNLVYTYTVARGGTVTVTSGNPKRVAVYIANPFTATKTFALTWTVSGVTVSVTVDTFQPSGGPAFPLVWAHAVTADVAGVIFTVVADGDS